MSSFVTGKGMPSQLCCNYYYTLNGITRAHLIPNPRCMTSIPIRALWNQ
jgi:hypothetical protein